MSLNLFYSKVVNNLGLYVDENGFIYSSDKANKVPITNDGKPLVLPTNENLNSIFTPDEDGNLVATKSIFNPMNEDIIKGDSPSLKKMKSLAERRLGHLVALAGELLLTLASNKDLQKKTSIQINKFLKRVQEANGQGIKQIVDDKTIDAWSKVYSKSLNRSQGFFSIYLKKAGTVDGTKYTRLATLASPVYDELLEVGDEGKVFDVTLRKKDVTMFKIILQYLVPEFETSDTFSIGSNDIENPAFLSLLQVYLSVVKKTNMVFKALKSVNQQTADEGIIDDLITEEELGSLSQYLPELKNIPNEHDLNRDILKTEKKQADLSKLSQPITPHNNINTNPIFQQQQSRIPEAPVAFGGESVQEDPLLKALGNNRAANYQNPMGVPIGINTIPQAPMLQQYNAPMYQPMMNNGLFQQQQMYTPPMGVNGIYR